MPLAARRRRKNPDEKLPEPRPAAQVMAPTRMKLRARRRDAAAAARGGPPEEEEEGEEPRSRERSGGRRRKNNAPPAASSSPPASSSSSAAASARAAMAAAAEDASPDSKCPICLDRFNNLAYLDRCLHRFCFPCIQEWSHNKAECPLCKQPFASILHSVRAEDDFKEYTLRPPPANSSVAATVAMVAAMASAARSDHQMRLMLRRHRGADGAETTARRRRGGRRAGVWEWYLDLPPPPPQHPAVSPVVAEDSEDGERPEERGVRGGADLAERGVIFEGLTGLGGTVAPVAPNDRASRRLMTRLAARQRLQREGGTVRRLRERETVAFRRALYRSAIRVRGVAGVNGNQGQQQRDITAESFRRNPVHLNRLRPWLRRELTVLYGAHGSLVDIVQRIIMARLARHGLEDTPTIEEELRPFLLARTDHFLHELVSFARSPLSLENYDLQAVYEPPTAAAMELDGTSSSSDSSSVIAISEGEEEERQAGGRPDEPGRAAGAHDDVIQTGSCLSLSAWDDETPGPSYSTAEPSCSLASLTFSPPDAANQEGGEKREEEVEEECLIVGYKKPIAERTPELVQLSSDSEEDEEKKKKKEEEEGEDTAEKLPPPPSATPPLAYLPTIPPSTSGAFTDEQDDKPKEKDGEEGGRPSRARSWSGSSQVSPLTSSVYSPSPSSSSPLCSSPQPSSLTPPTPSLSPSDGGGGAHRGEKPGGKRKYKSRHLDSDDKDPVWRPSRSQRREKRRERREKERRRRGRERGRRRERKRRDAHRESATDSSSRRCRDDRSPSVEIIYEGTIAYNATTQPPARKRRRKRQRKTQHSSSPVIITLDSDSSHDDVNNNKNNISSSSSSSPISSQQTVDFSDLPPLPLVHSAGVGEALNAEIGELPVDILDRGSDGSETEPAGPSEAAGPIAIDNSENSDLDVDVENVEESALLLGSDDGEDKGPMREVDTKATGASGAAPSTTLKGRKRAAEVSTSDSHLLATILNDLRGITAPKRDLSLNLEPNCSSDPRRKRFRDQCEVSRAHSNQDRWLTETRHPDPDLPNDIGDQNQGFGSPTYRPSGRPPPPCERPKGCGVGEEGKEVPPLLKLASPVRLYNRNTPPPLKHKDAGSPHLLPICPIDRHSTDTDPVVVNSHVDLGSNPTTSPIDSRLGPELPEDNRAVPPVSALKRHFTSGLALRGELVSTRTNSSIDMHSSRHLAPIDSQSSAPSKVGAMTTGTHSMSHKHPIVPHSSSGSEHRVDCVPHLDFSSFHSSKLHSGCDRTKEEPPSIDLHPVNSLSPIHFHSAKTGRSTDKPAQTDSTSRGCRDDTLKSSTLAPVDLHSSSTASSEGTSAGGDVFSGANCNNTSPPVFVSSTDSRTPSSPIDSHSSSKTENLSERLSRVSSVPTTAPSVRPSPIDGHPPPKSTIDLHSSIAAPEGLTDKKASPLVNHEERSPRGRPPPVDLHCPVPPANVRSSSFVHDVIDGHLNHTALPSSASQTSQRKSCSEPPVDSHSKLLLPTDSKPRNLFDPRPSPLFPQFPRSKHDLPIGSQPPVDSHPKNSFRPPTDNHIAPPSVENRWNSSVDAHPDSRPPADERPSSGVWSAHTPPNT